MKTQVQKPSAGKARYTPEYKQQALAQWRLGGRSAARVAAEIGIREQLIPQEPGALPGVTAMAAG